MSYSVAISTTILWITISKHAQNLLSDRIIKFPLGTMNIAKIYVFTQTNLVNHPLKTQTVSLYLWSSSANEKLSYMTKADSSSNDTISMSMRCDLCKDIRCTFSLPCQSSVAAP